MKYDAADYYDKPRTKIDENDDNSGPLMGHLICAISGAFVVCMIWLLVEWAL